MEKVIPKSKTKLLQKFFYTFRLEEAFVSSSMIRKHYKSVIQVLFSDIRISNHEFDHRTMYSTNSSMVESAIPI